MDLSRIYPIGAEVIGNSGVHFRVWAPGKTKLTVVFEDSAIPSLNLSIEKKEYFSGISDKAYEGCRYKFKIDDNDFLFPDPASKFQPEGPHGPSSIVNLKAFEWTDNNWSGLKNSGQVIYEMHVGTFTKEGTWTAAAEQLLELANLGVTTIEIMPIADFPGRFGWGYDGVNLFSPCRLYGSPKDLSRFIDKAHHVGIAVILDVVYNHLGPDGNYLKEFSHDYFSKKYKTEWGEAINFDDKGSGPVREYFLTNARYWIEAYHFDGLRLDATQSIYDSTSKHIISEISEAVKNNILNRRVILIAENEPQDVKIISPVEEGGYGIDAMWNDDFHHSAMVRLTGRNEAYYSDYLGNPQEFISSAKYGFLFQGQRYKWQKNRRGTSAIGYKPYRFVNYIQNHDQVANSGRGLYCHQLASYGNFKTMSLLLLLLPQTPMIFQGQEFAASNSFFYFADHNKELAKLVIKGRAEFLSQFRSLALPETQAWLPDPTDIKTFENSKLDFKDRSKNIEVYSLYKDAIRIRKSDEIISMQAEYGIDGAVLSEHAFIIRYFSKNYSDRLLVINFGRDLHLNPAPEPLLAPNVNSQWEILFSTEDLKYGGIGTAPLDTENNWMIPGHTGVVLKPVYSGDNNEGQIKENMLDERRKQY